MLLGMAYELAKAQGANDATARAFILWVGDYRMLTRPSDSLRGEYQAFTSSKTPREYFAMQRRLLLKRIMRRAQRVVRELWDRTETG